MAYNKNSDEVRLTGRQVVGVVAAVAAIIWFVAYQKNQRIEELQGEANQVRERHGEEPVYYDNDPEPLHDPYGLP